MYKEEYPKIKKAYVANTQNKAYIENYLIKASPEEKTDVENYIKAYDAWDAENANENMDAEKLKNLQEELDKAAEKLDESVNKKALQQSTATQEAFIKEFNTINESDRNSVMSYLGKD